MSLNFSVNSNVAVSGILQNLNALQNQVQTSFAQLSSGNRVNQAADNPSGYAIAQQMKQNVNGLNTAVMNAQNGISMIETASGAMQQVGNILQTLKVLSVEASNGTQNAGDLSNLQQEWTQLTGQINNIANQTQYNNIYLFTASGGSATSTTNSATAPDGTKVSLAANGTITLTYSDGSTIVAARNGPVTANYSNGDQLISNRNGTITDTTGGVTTTHTGTAANPDGVTASVSSGVVTNGWHFDGAVTSNPNGSFTSRSPDGTEIAVSSTGTITILSAKYFPASTRTFAPKVVSGGGSSNSSSFISALSGITLQIGANYSQTLMFSTHDISANGLGLGSDIGSQTLAQAANSSVDAAISTLVNWENQLGATQNQLNFSVNNIQNSAINLNNAKSTITDANMAKDYTSFVQAQVATNIGTSILSQAQQQTGLILKLLS